MSTLQKTGDYDAFEFMPEQRPPRQDTPEYLALWRSMERYGWLPAYPMMARHARDKLLIVDGQHRFLAARTLGLPVYYVVDFSDVEVAEINRGQRPWTLPEYAHRWAVAGRTSYRVFLDCRAEYKLADSIMITALYGVLKSAQGLEAFRSGEFKVHNERVAREFFALCAALKAHTTAARTVALQGAIWVCFFTDSFSPHRLLAGVESRPKLLDRCRTQGEYLDAVEQVYNYRRRDKVPLRFQAEEARRNQHGAVGKGARA